MKNLHFDKLIIAMVLLISTGFANAGTVSIAGYEGEGGDFVENVLGVWSFSDRITFSTPGSYSLQLTDFNEPLSFDYLGALIATPTDKIANFSFKYGTASSNGPVFFDVAEGEEYWLSLIAITDSAFNAGTFGLKISEVAAIPLPPAFMLMLTSLLGLAAYARQGTA